MLELALAVLERALALLTKLAHLLIHRLLFLCHLFVSAIRVLVLHDDRPLLGGVGFGDSPNSVTSHNRSSMNTNIVRT